MCNGFTHLNAPDREILEFGFARLTGRSARGSCHQRQFKLKHLAAGTSAKKFRIRRIIKPIHFGSFSLEKLDYYVLLIVFLSTTSTLVAPRCRAVTRPNSDSPYKLTKSAVLNNYIR